MGRIALIAVRNLLQNRRRTLLLGAAIAVVTALLVLLVSISNGIQHTMLRAATTLATGHVNVGGFFKITTGQAAPVVTHYQPIMQIVRRAVPPSALVVDRVRGWGKIISPATTIQVGVSGVDVRNEPGLRSVLKLVAGNLDDLERPNTILLFEKQAKRLEVGVGDQLTVSMMTTRGAHNAIDVQVVAIAKEMGLISNFHTFMPKKSVRDAYLLGSHATGAIQIYLDQPNRAEQLAGRLRALLARKGYRIMEPQGDPYWMKFPVVTREDWTGQKLDITTWKDELSMLTWVVTAFDVITSVLIGILLVIIVIGVMNVMWMTIRERTREIGTLRAIGMSRWRVLVMILMEAALLSVTATCSGALLGMLASGALNAAKIRLSEGFAVFLMRDTLHLVVSMGSVLLSIVVISGITTLFALYPAYRAARMPPVTAIHHVG